MFLKRNLKEVREQSDLLLSCHWFEMPPEEQQELISGFCAGYILPPLLLFCPTTFRARQNVDGKLFMHVKELLAPPPQAVTVAGRLNRVNESTLYLAGTGVSAVVETKAPRGSTVSVLACRMLPGAEALSLAPVAMTRLQGSRRIGPMSPLLTAGPLGYQPFADALRQNDMLNQWQLQDGTIGALLVANVPAEHQQTLYKATNEVRDHLYRTYPYFDGVQYPSILVQRTSPNIALDRNRWNDIKPFEVWVVEVSEEFYHRPYVTPLSTHSLLRFGIVEPDGSVVYQHTSKTFLTALHDFKQRYGMTHSKAGPPSLVRPFTRYRISYGRSLSRKIFDFMLPD